MSFKEDPKEVIENLFEPQLRLIANIKFSGKKQRIDIWTFKRPNKSNFSKSKNIF